MPQDIQDKLAAILGLTRILYRASDLSVRHSPRLLASTGRSLDELQERLRSDLYERIAEVVLEVPPLRSRHGDLLPLAECFLGRLGRRYNRQFQLSWSCLALLLSYSFPSNVRELESILERVAAQLLQTPRKITEAELRPFLIETRGASRRATAVDQPLDLRRIEQLATERAPQHSRGNQTKAAVLLGISRTTLYKKLRRFIGGITQRLTWPGLFCSSHET